jgi:DNA sulfur modification protein DndE
MLLSTDTEIRQAEVTQLRNTGAIVGGGPIADPLLIALTQRCHQDGLNTDPQTLATQLRLHLHRGIGYLAGDPLLKRLQDLCHLARPNPTPASEPPASDSPLG